jgi:two-component system sensor histidine kinase CreC
VGVTLWLVSAVRRLRRYAQQAEAGQDLAPPAVPGELGELALAMDAMRRRLEGRERLEHDVRALTHELKSPLAALRASGELLQDELPPEDRQRFAAQVLAQTERLQTLVERVLALSRLEAQVGLGERQPRQLAEAVDAQLERHAAPLHQRGLSVVWQTRAQALVAADPHLLDMAVGNLLSNAIDFAPLGSALVLAVEVVAGQAVFSLRDSGPGVPAAAFSQLGQRFFSTARPGSRVKGSGLGLAIVRRIAGLHGGGLGFEPAEPGLRVTLSLPLAG